MKPVEPSTLPLAGRVVIEASAGTGKTYTITSLYLRLVVERRLKPREILVVTFTRAATAELRARIRARLESALARVEGHDRGDDPFASALLAEACAQSSAPEVCAELVSALDELDDAPVLTIHGFCQRVLAEHALESGAALGSEVVADPTLFLEEIADDFIVRELAQASEGRAALLYKEHVELLDLARSALATHELRILPSAGDEPELDLVPFRALQTECRELFHGAREQIRASLLRVGRIAKYVPDWLPRIAHGLAAPYPPIFDDKALVNVTLSGLAGKLKAGTAAPDHPFFSAMERLHEAEERLLAQADEARIALRRRFVEQTRSELDARTERRAKSTFDALLATVHGALKSPSGPALQRKLLALYRVAMLDEFQDTDALQYGIFARLFGAAPHALFMIGDPKQAIYGFRGADVRAYTRARDDAGEQVFTLDTNYRSDPSLLRALNALYAASARPFVQEDIQFVPVHAPAGRVDRLRPPPGDPRRALDLVLHEGSEDDALIERLASEIVSVLNARSTRTTKEGPRTVRPRDIAVLCRTNVETLKVASALARRAVPSQSSAAVSVFDTDDATHVERALAAVVHPSDMRILRAFLASPYGGKSAHELAALEEDDRAVAMHRAHVASAHELLVSHGAERALAYLLAAYEAPRRLLGRHEGLRSLENFEHLRELLGDVAQRLKLGPQSLLRVLQRAIASEDCRNVFGADAHLLRPLEQADSVNLVTVHKSKGLEYPLVYALFFSDARVRPSEALTYHDPSAADALTLVLGGPELERARGLRGEEDRAEHARLLYVALTRAEHRVTLVVARPKALPNSALSALLAGEALADAAEAFAAIGARASELAAGMPDAISVRSFAEASSTRYAPDATKSERLALKPRTRTLTTELRVASFSALASSALVAHTLDEALDHDHAAPPLVQAAPLALQGFPRGPTAGQLIHEVIEQADFAASVDELLVTIAPFVAEGRLDRAQAEVLAPALHAAFASPILPDGTRLRDVPRARRMDELEFLLPVARAFDAEALARAFDGARLPAFAADYGVRLAELGFARFSGFLRGFIDLVFEHDGRYYVVDYKSNDLGQRALDYAPERLSEPMLGHHYVLQYHLYTLALHRHLRQRLRGYDYERHVGGVLYLFLRGMSPEHAPYHGVFADRPARALIDALDGLIGEASA